MLFFMAGVVIGFCVAAIAIIIGLHGLDRIVVRVNPPVVDTRNALLQSLERADMVLAFAVGDAPIFGTKRYVEAVQ